jgi:hypothetical protein
MRLVGAATLRTSSSSGKTEGIRKCGAPVPQVAVSQRGGAGARAEIEKFRILLTKPPCDQGERHDREHDADYDRDTNTTFHPSAGNLYTR